MIAKLLRNCTGDVSVVDLSQQEFEITYLIN